MNNRDSLQLKLELLRMRAQVERTEVAAALLDLKTSTRRIGALAATVARVGGALGGAGGAAGGWAGSLLAALGAIGAKPLWASVALAAVHALRRHPVAAIALGFGALAATGWRLRRRRRAAPEDPG